MPKIGDRVGALMDRNDLTKTVRFFGYGVYNGDLPCEGLGGFSNPNITLDNGKIVWGCECWWSPENNVKEKLDWYKENGYEIVDVDVDEERSKAA